jgi:hypothetical protein
VLPYELSDWFLPLCEECHRNFDGNYIEHIDCFCSIGISMMLILLIH